MQLVHLFDTPTGKVDQLHYTVELVVQMHYRKVHKNYAKPTRR